MAENDPPIFDVPVFNPAYFLDEDEITKSFLKANFLEFPIGQGLETLPDLRVENTEIHLGTNTSTGDESVAIGDIAEAEGDRSVAIGNAATANGNESIAIGDGASTSTFTNAVAIGNGATATANGDFVLGNNLMILRQGNFRAFKPVNNDNGSFAGAALVRTLATDITFNGGELVIVCDTCAFRSSFGLCQLTLKCFNSSNVLQWTLTLNHFNVAGVRDAFGNTQVFTGIPAQTGASLQLERNNTITKQDADDRTNVLIIELPLS
jgi:hypothetical protein